MIQANELRIGNLIWWLHEESESFKVVDLKTLDDLIYNQEDPNDSEDRFARFGCNYAPIPLSEEILIKAGFEEIYKSDFSVKLELKNFVEFEAVRRGDNEWLIRYKGFTFNHIKSLHHLQNFFHSITGQELNVNF